MHRKPTGQLRDFGTHGIEAVVVTNADKLPTQARGVYTGRLYVWNAPKASVWVDARDVGSVVSILCDNGLELDDLDGEKIRERKAQLAERTKQKREKEAAPVPSEEVDE